MRNITTSSKGSSYVTTFGPRIAAACDEGTVSIYDSITGVLKLSLSPADPVHAIGGTPDGSLLFCAHKPPSITARDMQTGGLIHTFTLERSAEDIAVSLKGRYLACGSSDGSVEVWEAAHEMEGAVIWTSSPATHFCWLEPERLLAVSTKTSVRVWDIIAGTILWSFSTQLPLYNMVYSRELRKLAVMARPGDVITLIDAQTGRSAPALVPPKLACFAFCQTTEELVCGTETHGLQVFNILTRCWRHIEHPDTTRSVSSLPNGTMVADFVDSGIQLLNLGKGHAASQRPITPALNVHDFDQGRIIAVSTISRDHIMLLKLTDMSPLLRIPVKKTHTIPTHRTHILCASLDNRVAVYCLSEQNTAHLQFWEFEGKHGPSIDYRWTVEIGGLPSMGGISPKGTCIVTFHDVDNRTFICVWDVSRGNLRAQLPANHIHPLDITFGSETRFYSHQNTYRIPYVIHKPTLPDPSPEPATLSHSITSSGPLPLIRGLQKKPYDVDDNHEWVISNSKRICWIPPGYMGSAQPSYWWIGSSLVMAGQDGTLRKLDFRESI